MVYAYYILAVLLIGFLCLRVISYWTARKNLEAKNRRSMKRGFVSSGMPGPSAAMNRRAKWPGADKHTRNVVQREVRKVPVPWGWPGHTATHADGREWQLSEAMRSFTDHLVKQKELANGTSLNPRSSRSIRALLEDRYAPMNRDSMRSIKYKTVKAPLLRDPDAPVDQMDSFGTRGLKPSLSKLQYQARMKANFEKMSKKRRVKSLDIKDIKQPWGW